MDTHDPDQTAAHLKKICNSYIEGMNARDFDPNSPRWQDTLAPDFRLLVASDAMYKYLTPGLVVINDNTKSLEITDMCEVLRQSAEANPKWHSRLIDAVVTICKDEKNGPIKQDLGVEDAEVWCSCEHSGIPDGVTRSAMWIGYFATLDGQWRLVRARHASGMGSMDLI